MFKEKRIGLAIVAVLAISIVGTGMFVNSLGDQEKENKFKGIRNIPFLTAEGLYEEDYVDGLVTVRPTSENVHLKLGEPMWVELNITYEGRNSAPEFVEIRGAKDRVTVQVPYKPLENGEPVKGGYVEVNDFIEYSPNRIKLEKGETVQAFLVIEFPRNFPLSQLKEARKDYIPMPFGYELIREDKGEVRPLEVLVISRGSLEVIL